MGEKLNKIANYFLLIGIITLIIVFLLCYVRKSREEKSIKQEQKETVKEETKLTMYRYKDGSTGSLKYNPFANSAGEEIFE